MITICLSIDSYLEYRLQNNIISTIDASYSGAEGIREAFAKCSDILSNFRMVEEKKIIEKLFQEVNTNSEIKKSERVKIEEDSSYSVIVNESIQSVDELNIYQNAQLEEKTVNDRLALCKGDIDSELKDDLGQSNLERMDKGNSPLDQDGKPIELHHVGQNADSPLAELSRDEHRGKENFTVLHDSTLESKIDRVSFNKEKSEHWKERAEQLREES